MNSCLFSIDQNRGNDIPFHLNMKEVICHNICTSD
ncbi:hypothetical protein BOVA604_3788 [Bacteroides ovatus]|jgi:hypothetical protein|nr:hypothetical protein BOVA604_3788 [Bacteroides ovatus]